MKINITTPISGGVWSESNGGMVAYRYESPCRGALEGHVERRNRDTSWIIRWVMWGDGVRWDGKWWRPTGSA